MTMRTNPTNPVVSVYNPNHQPNNNTGCEGGAGGSEGGKRRRRSRKRGQKIAKLGGRRVYAEGQTIHLPDNERGRQLAAMLGSDDLTVEIGGQALDTLGELASVIAAVLAAAGAVQADETTEALRRAGVREPERSRLAADAWVTALRVEAISAVNAANDRLDNPAAVTVVMLRNHDIPPDDEIDRLPASIVRRYPALWRVWAGRQGVRE